MKAATLRKSILQYAIQGKLVPQNLQDEPAYLLLAKIRKEKQELIKQGKLKKEKPLAPITEDEKPFDIPDSWVWVRYGTVAYLHTGNSINAEEKKKNYTNLEEGYFYIGTKDVGFDGRIDYENGVRIPFSTHFDIAKTNATILCIEGGSAGRKIAKLNQDVCFGNKLCSFESIIIDPNYLYYSLQTTSFIESFKSSLTGMIGGVGVNGLKILPFPLPPLVEQERIVAKIEELMILVDKYEKLEIELEILEKQFPERLKKSILQYAIQGKLVPQLDCEGNAKTLLDSIKKEKQELIKQGKLKKEKPLAPITEEDKPFDIPDSWEWARLEDVILLLSGRDLDPYNYSDKVLTHPYITGASNFSNGKLIINRWTGAPVVLSNVGDLLFTCKGTIGEMAYNTIGSCHIARQVMALRPLAVSKDFIKTIMSSAVLKLKGKANSMIPGISRENILELLVAIPPLAEQQRIVDKIEELFALVDLISQGKKLIKDDNIINQPKVLPFIPITAKQAQLPKNDFNDFELAARAQTGANPKTVEESISQIKEYYGKKN